MKIKNITNFKRIIAIVLSLSVIQMTDLSVFAAELDEEERTVIVCDENGNITYETVESQVDTLDNMSDNELIVTQRYDEGDSSDLNINRSLLANESTWKMPVIAPTTDPYKNICRVETIFPDKTCKVSTGVLVHNNLLLTSAHGIYEENHGGYGNTIVYPGYHAGVNNKIIKPFGSANVTTRRLPAGYVNEQKIEYDWALLELDRRFDSWYSFGYAPDYSKLVGRTVEAYGYPEGITEMQYDTGSITEAFDRLLYTTIQTEKGMSGGPVVDTQTGAVIGIVQGKQINLITGQFLYNKTVRINETLYNLINTIKAELN